MAGDISKENGKKGGRPVGSFSKTRMEAIELRTLYAEKAREHGGAIAEALIEKALTGDIAAIKEFNDRAYGKAKGELELYGKDGKDLIPTVPTERILELAEKLRLAQSQ